MVLRNVVIAVLLSLLSPQVVGQGSTAALEGKALVGKWTGKWLSAGRSRASGDMEMELFAADADRVTGQVTFATSATPPCSSE